MFWGTLVCACLRWAHQRFFPHLSWFGGGRTGGGGARGGWRLRYTYVLSMGLSNLSFLSFLSPTHPNLSNSHPRKRQKKYPLLEFFFLNYQAEPSLSFRGSICSASPSFRSPMGDYFSKRFRKCEFISLGLSETVGLLELNDHALVGCDSLQF